MSVNGQNPNIFFAYFNSKLRHCINDGEITK